MNRLKKTVPPARKAVPAASLSIPLSVIIERALLIGMIALIVARALVAGDDPGRLRLASSAGPLTLNALTFLLLFAWAVWRGVTKRKLTCGPGWIVAAGLLIMSGLVFISAAGDNRYQRPGWFVAWDWLATACLCFLTWQLASTPALIRGMMAVMLATAACLSAQALYQEISPALGIASPEMAELPAPSIPLAGDDEFDLSLCRALPPRGAFRATFDQPDTFAGLLLLLLPVSLVWAISAWRARESANRWRRLTILVPSVLMVALVYSLMAWLASSPAIVENWGLAETMLQESPLFGIGPGNFWRRAPGASGTGGFWIGLAATAGLLAAGVLTLTTALALAIAFRRRKSVVAETPTKPERDGARWAFYYGGTAGLLLGMILATGDIPAEADASEMLRLGVVAGARALVWFAAIAILEIAAVSAGALMRFLLLGILLLALFGIISDGLSSPALQQPFWLSATLVLTGSGIRQKSGLPEAGIRADAVTRNRSLPLAWIGVPIALALIVANIVHVYVPAVATASAVRSARAASKAFPHAHWKTIGRKDADRIRHIHDADEFLSLEILRPLQRALEVDSANSSLKIEKARWNRWHWLYLHELRYDANAKAVALETLQLGEKADQIDPRNLAGKLSQFEVVLLFARASTATFAQLSALEKLIGQIVERQAYRETALRHRVVLTLLEQKNLEVADSWSVALLRLDAGDDDRRGRLSAEQRHRLLSRIKRVIKQPSQELAEYLVDGVIGH
jgi:hypothetical protein